MDRGRHAAVGAFDSTLTGQNATRFTAHGITLAPGDTRTLRGVPDPRQELQAALPAAKANSQLCARAYRE